MVDKTIFPKEFARLLFKQIFAWRNLLVDRKRDFHPLNRSSILRYATKSKYGISVEVGKLITIIVIKHN